MRLFLIPLLLVLLSAAPAAAQLDERRFITVDDARTLVEIRGLLGVSDGTQDLQVQVLDGTVVLSGRHADPEGLAELTTLLESVEGVAAVENRVEISTDVIERLAPVARRLMRQLDRLLHALPLLAVALLVWAGIGWLGYRIAERPWPWDRIAPNAFIAEVIRQVIRLASVLFGAVIALDILGARALLGTLLGAAGIFGLAVGFAVRDVVENFIASILLSLRSPFRPNDLIEVAGDTGRIARLTARATILISPDGNQIRIPNATVFKARIINFSRQRERRFTLRVPVRAGADLNHAIVIAQRVLTEAPFVLERPAHSVWLADVNAEGVATLEAAAWIDTEVSGFATARGEALRRMLIALCENGIALPGIDPSQIARAPVAEMEPERAQEAAVEDLIVEAEAEGNDQLLRSDTRDE